MLNETLNLLKNGQEEAGMCLLSFALPICISEVRLNYAAITI